MNDFYSVALTVLLLATNAFFVAAEFALISARRDRLQTLAEQGKRSAVTVLRAGEQLPVMLAGAQLGITVCSILLGRVGEPAVADLLRKPFGAMDISESALHSASFVIALAIVVILHVLLGEMVPKNIAIAGPEKAAMLLVPPYQVYMGVARPFVVFYNWCANVVLRIFGVTPRDELSVAISTVELSEMIAESRSEGLLDAEEHVRLTRALQIRSRLVSDVAIPLQDIRVVPISAPGAGPTVGAVIQALTETGYSRFPVTDGSSAYIGYLHIKDVLPQADNYTAVLDRSMVRPLPLVPSTLTVPEALSWLRRNNSHLALVTTDGFVTAMVALEDLVEDLVGTVRDGTHRV
ncbi:CBS domain containing-hemolysin-like protein [Mycobacterium sp. MAA66]|uniref:hemolysin family protein n=1 Tax=Mycobacterium sp. MAA66 TaxID=3156297 RepID=UPI0035143C29